MLRMLDVFVSHRNSSSLGDEMLLLIIELTFCEW